MIRTHLIFDSKSISLSNDEIRVLARMISSSSNQLSIVLSRFKQCSRSFQALNRRTQHSLSAIDRDDEAQLFRSLSTRSLQHARHLLDKMPPRPGTSRVVFWTSLLSKYARDGFVDEARELFELMPERNLVTWNALLSAYLQSGRHMDALHLFEGMPERDVVSWTSMLCGFSRAGKIDEARRLFNVMPERNVVSWNSMISGLVRNGCLDEAKRMFDEMPVRNLVSWNVMISGFVENFRMAEARQLFDAMPDANVVTWTSMISGYCRVGSIDEAYGLFLKSPVRNVVSWTAMIGGFAWNGFYEDALRLFLEMKGFYDVKPNEETFISLFYACSGLDFPRLGKQLHAHIVLNGLDDVDYDGRLMKSLIYMYSKYGMMDEAQYLFNKSSGGGMVESLNYMINGYIRVGQMEKARSLFDAVPFRNMISWTSMISGYFHVGDVMEASRLFNQMPKRDAVSWTAMVSGYVQNELFIEAIEMFCNMRVAGASPLDSTYSSLLGAVGAMAYLELGKQFHCLLSKARCEFDVFIDNSLISMYAKCGEIEDARCIFGNMTFRDVVSWNSMIIGLSHHGLANEVLKLFNIMQTVGVKPNSVTFLGILSAFSHTGMIDRGWELFNSMTQQHSIRPDVQHYICMIDLLGRAGKVEEAEKFVNSLPFEPGLAIWGALLGVCNLRYSNMDVAKRAAMRVLELDPLNAPAHVLLCNIYAASAQPKEERMLRREMGLKGVKKFPGCSWILLKGRVVTFLSGDSSHPHLNEIISLLFGN